MLRETRRGFVESMLSAWSSAHRFALFHGTELRSSASAWRPGRYWIAFVLLTLLASQGCTTEGVWSADPASRHAAPVYQEAFPAERMHWYVFGTLGTLSCLVPGWCLYYSGMSGHRDLRAVLQQLLHVMAFSTLIWVLWAYSLAFAPRGRGPDVDPSAGSLEGRTTWVGGGDYVFLRRMASQIETDRPSFPIRQRSDGVPNLLFMMFQLSWFAAAAVPITAALSGMYTNRLRVWISFALWSTVVFAPLTHAVLGGGGLSDSLDFGGVLPAHVGVGVSLLIFHFMARPLRESSRRGTTQATHPALLGVGTFLIWCGTLFQLAVRTDVDAGLVANVLAGTHVAASAGVAGAMLIPWGLGRVANFGDVCRGALFGMIANSAAAGFVVPQSSLLIGLLAAALGNLMVRRLPQAGEAALLHSFGGALGLLLTGVFATASVAGLSADGTEIDGVIGANFGNFVQQLQAIGAAALIASLGSIATVLICGISLTRQPLIRGNR